MRIIGFVFGLALIGTILRDTFETVILPRRVTRRLRLTNLFYSGVWIPSSAIGRRITDGRRREKLLALFGPLSLLMLLGVWALGLIFGFALLFWGIHARLNNTTGEIVNFATYMYLSGETFFTLGYGDVAPLTPLARVIAIAETANGFALLAVVISYLPVLYQAFSSREASISLLDARAGSPSSAVELLRRHRDEKGFDDLTRLLGEWERWSAELLESHLSYPVLCYFRSQHDNQSWLRALTTILDTCAIVMMGVGDAPVWQAKMTFAMARHAVVDLAQVLRTAPRPMTECMDRLPAADLERIRVLLAESHIELIIHAETQKRLTDLRKMYEPYVFELSELLVMPLPPWILPTEAIDNWKTSAWGRIQ